MVWEKIDVGIRMVGERANFSVGMSLPRATPAWSGTMHSTSWIPRFFSQAIASS